MGIMRRWAVRPSLYYQTEVPRCLRVTHAAALPPRAGFHTRLDRSSASVGHDGWIGDHVLAALRRGRLTLALRLRRVAATWHSNSTHTEALVER